MPVVLRPLALATVRAQASAAPAPDHHMRTARRVLASLVLAACASSPKAAPPAVKDGVYEFMTSTGERGELRGRMVYAGEVVSIEPELGICRLDGAFASAERLRYLCDNTQEVEHLALLIDKRYPTTRSAWTGSVRVRRTRTVCVQYATQNGRQVCVRSETQTYEERVTLSGPLTFRPAPTG